MNFVSLQQCCFFFLGRVAAAVNLMMREDDPVVEEIAGHFGIDINQIEI